MSTCAETTDFNNRVITSPNFPNGYRNNETCGWTIEAEEGQIIELTMETFDLEYSNDCSYDSVQAFDGRNSSSRSILAKKLCGTHGTMPKKFRTTGKYLYLEFISDLTRIEKGFRFFYSVKGG